MKISARNVLAGKVQKVTKGAVDAEVMLVLSGGETVVSIITNSSVDSLGLEVGGAAYAIIKASDVIVGEGLEGSRLSARNILSGLVECAGRSSQQRGGDRATQWHKDCFIDHQGERACAWLEAG